MKTLLLDVQEWDLVPDLQGNIACAADPYSQAQDAASAIKLFEGELWYNTVRGVPYWRDILGKYPPLSYVRAVIEAAALSVPGVTRARCYISSFQNRTVTGQVQLSNDAGQTSMAAF